MIDKVIYSHWSKPAKDKYVGFNSKEAFADCARLSIIYSRKWFDKVELITDKKGFEFLIDDLKLPFTDVKIELDKLNHIGSTHWAIGKLYSCKMQKEPFMHLDFDAIWFKKPPDHVLMAGVGFQNKEFDKEFHWFYKPLMDEAKNWGLSVKANFDRILAFNCGFMVFNDRSFLDEWFVYALEYIGQYDKYHDNNADIIHCSSIIFEQFFLANLCEYYGTNSVALKDDWIDDETAEKYGYTHLISVSKRNKSVEEKIHKRVLKEAKKGLC